MARESLGNINRLGVGGHGLTLHLFSWSLTYRDLDAAEAAYLGSDGWWSMPKDYNTHDSPIPLLQA